MNNILLEAVSFKVNIFRSIAFLPFVMYMFVQLYVYN